ncbi:sensor histidine kinase [Gryllotalpicola ginsengisoli]|uniref:sensor histidine kinase n=1 Tax=Gryllotalpicola ginsengisoli TaxID=444608 RepID=UPI0003B52E10|nr:HAMP domain-containing sensor histidine kinase [Gryllotalpicola ginsengisoli]
MISRPLRSLRWRIVLIASALVAASSIVIGGITLLALHGYLVGQVDDLLTAASNRTERDTGQLPHAPEGSTPAPHPPTSEFVGVPGQSARTVVAVVDSDGEFIVSGFVDEDGTRHALSQAAKQALAALRPGAQPQTVDLGGKLGPYRAASVTDVDGDTVITALPLGSAYTILWRLAWVIGAVVVASAVVAAVAGAVVIGRALRPLRRVAATAASVTDVQLDRGDVRLDARVEEADLDSTEEVGQVGHALNALLEHVGDALAVRQASEQTMRRFVADASHELRTPLATVRAYAQLSAREHPELPDDLERNIARIDRESVRMGELVDQLLLLARLDAGAAAGVTQPARDEVNLSLVVAEAAGDARLAASDHSWSLDLDAEPVVVRGDESQLRRLVRNLLTNASTHTPPGTSVRVGLRAASGACTLTVADDGPGVPAELQPTVFERFARGDSARNRDGGSTGLGLAIVKAIAEAHGGSVALESAPGRTVFTVTLPAA